LSLRVEYANGLEIVFSLTFITFAILAYTNFKLNKVRQHTNPPISKFISNDDLTQHFSLFYSKIESKKAADNFRDILLSTPYFKGGIGVLSDNLVLLDDEQSLKVQLGEKIVLSATKNELVSSINGEEICSDIFLLRGDEPKNSVNMPAEKQSGDVIFIHKDDHLLVFLLDENKAFYRKIYWKN